jgi:hypothetical protein
VDDEGFDTDLMREAVYFLPHPCYSLLQFRAEARKDWLLTPATQARFTITRCISNAAAKV